MRYITLTSKFLYYLGMSIQFLFIIFYVVLFELLFRANEFNGLIILTIFGALWVLQFFVLNRWSIFIKIDTEKRRVFFGNLFFKNGCKYEHINKIKSSWLPNLYWINIGDEKYNFYAARIDLEDLRRTLEVEK